MGLKTTGKPKMLLVIYLLIKGFPHPEKITLGVNKERGNRVAKHNFYS